MIFEKLFGRKAKTEEPQAVAAPAPAHPVGNDGWVELQGARVVAYDPAGNGRFATIAPEGGVRLWVNGSEVTELAVVSAADEITYAADPLEFFRLTLAEDHMSVTVHLTADPARVPDSVALEGQHPVRVRPGYSSHAARRGGAPREAVLAELVKLGVQFGLDEAAIERELAHPTYQPVCVAHGQEAAPADPGEWTWKADGLGLVAPGQVIALHQGGHPERARITVLGDSTHIYDEGAAAPEYVPGPGTRLLAGGRLVAAAAGRARKVAAEGGSQQVEVFPVKLVDGDVTADLTDLTADLLVKGNIRGAIVATSGEVVVTGSVERSEITAAGIIVRGSVALSKLSTIQPGHFAPLRGELGFMQKRVEELGDSMSAAMAVKEAWFKEAAAFIRALWRKADELHVADPAFKVAMNDLFSLVGRSEAAATFNRNTAQSLSLRLNVVLNEAARAAATGDVRAQSLAQTTVWAGRDVYVEENVVGSAIYCGGDMETSDQATSSQTEIVAGGEVRLGVLASLRGTAPVIVRARRIEAAEVQSGCAFEFGFERKELGADMFKVSAGATGRGYLAIKQG
jgi:hypothetical protein